MPRSAAASLESVSAPVFAALGDATRLRLVSRLTREGPQSTTTLTSGLPITRQAVTKHLRVLKGAGLVRSAARGRETVWRIERQPLEQAQLHLQMISAQWDRTLDRLRRLIED